MSNDDVMGLMDKCDKQATEFLAKIQTLEKQLDDMKLRNQLLRDRPDLPIERLEAYNKIVKEREALSKTISVLAKYNVNKNKAIAIEFFYWWHNQPGANTEQGFDDWWVEIGEAKYADNLEA